MVHLSDQHTFVGGYTSWVTSVNDNPLNLYTYPPGGENKAALSGDKRRLVTTLQTNPGTKGYVVFHYDV